MIVLTFHGIGEPGRALEEGEADVWVSRGVYEGVLDLVRGRGEVVVTFDDGNASDWEIGFPALRERGMTGRFFLVSDRMDREGFVRTEWAREMVGRGMTIGSHGKAHVAWRGLPDEALREETVGAKRALEEKVGVRIEEAACPFGSYDRRVVRALRDAGFTRVYTSDRWSADEREFVCARHTVRRGDSVEDVRGWIECRATALERLKARARLMAKRWR
ncbi:MAG: polysaccharide deacetylase family protein [Phycisphaerales bacterium]